MKTKILLTIILSILICKGICQALGDGSSAYTAQFLRLGAGARGFGMSGVMDAIADDSTAVYWNPGGLAQLNHAELNITHGSLFNLFHHNAVHIAYPLPRSRSVIGAGLIMLTQDPIEAVTKDYEPAGYSFSPESMVLSAAYSKRFDLKGNVVYAGGSLKYIHESLEKYSASAVATDIGSLIRLERFPNMSCAVVLRHLGTKETFIREKESLPAEMNISAAYNLLKKGKSYLKAASGLVMPFNGPAFVRLGVEYSSMFSPQVSWALRTGVRTMRAPDIETLSRFSLGAGLGFKNISSDFSFQYMGKLGAIYHISLGYAFTTKTKDSNSVSLPVIEVITPARVKDFFVQGLSFELIDVRSTEQFQRNHLVGARNIPFNSLGNFNLPKDRPIVVYCSEMSCNLSNDSARALLKLGYQDVRVLEGGLERALAEGLQLDLGHDQSKDKPVCMLSGPELEKKLGISDSPFIIDLRPEIEFKAGHIPGANNIPLEKIDKSILDISRSRKIVIYDRLTERSLRGAEILRKEVPDVCVLEGGITTWNAEARPLE